MNKQEYVRAEACDERHSATSWILKLLVGLGGVFLAIALYAIGFANQAATRAADISTAMEAHIAAQTETERHLVQRLDEIKQELRDNRMLLEELLRNGKSKTP